MEFLSRQQQHRKSMGWAGKTGHKSSQPVRLFSIHTAVLMVFVTFHIRLFFITKYRNHWSFVGENDERYSCP